MNVFAENPSVPDGSFSVLFSRQEGVGFIGGILELFPANRVESDIKMFKEMMVKVADVYKQDYKECSNGLINAFSMKGFEENLGGPRP